ncbi:hypothetical protein EZH22_11240 [Xanthobacter dioxanivorans]|uniref:Uncharacterized protein n=1 Tax=Xanthobacter dioxanivorans TaxID=2528964 RepID=A0A974PTF8_9HYPH|nr:hypothetical protein [Xanthobacter dioxanivorans]QRG08795.1 hypothetical protein EZH22_11240 [Xanthobacter dioxanivorans]
MLDFSSMGFDRALGIIGLVVGILSIWLARHYYKKSLVTKIIGFCVTEPIRLSTSSDVKSSVDGEIYDYLEKRYYLLWNKGSSAIEYSDFISDIQIKRDAEGEEEHIVRVSIVKKDSLVDIKEMKDGSFRLNLLRPGEAIVFCVYYREKNFMPTLYISTKVKEMVRREFFTIDIMRYIGAFLASIFALSAVLTDFFGAFSIDDNVIKYFENNYSKPVLGGMALVALFSMFGAIIAIGYLANYIFKLLIWRNRSGIVNDYAAVYLSTLNLKHNDVWRYYDIKDLG